MTISNLLNKLYESPKKYLADVCFCFPSVDIWAHRAILLTRAPKEFLQQFAPSILKDTQVPLKLDMSHVIDQEQLSSLICFWYTDSFRLSESNELVEYIPELDRCLAPGYTQWMKDLQYMLVNKIAADVAIKIVSSDDSLTNTTVNSFKAHKFILAVQSPYFYSLFCTQFQEALSSTIHLPDDLFNSEIVYMILNFFYTEQITLPEASFDDPLEIKRHHLSILQKSFYAADYLGHGKTLCNALLDEMQKVCHQFKCHCPDCAVLLPSMLAWSEKQSQVEFRKTLISFYSDPVLSISTLWSQRSFSLLIDSLVPSASILGQEALGATLRHEPVIKAPLIEEIERRTFSNVNRHNGVQVMQSLYLCLSHIRSTDPVPTWSRPSLDLLKPLLDYTARIISKSFEFYCVEYPILPCCVDGTGFSFDFLNFLLHHSLRHMQQIHATGIYQAITRDLAKRHEAIRNVTVGEILTKARGRCADYISQNWIRIKSQNGFANLDKSILQQLSEEINVPYRTLSYRPDILKRSRTTENIIGSTLRTTKSVNPTMTQSPIYEYALRSYASFGSLPDRLLFMDPIMHEKRYQESFIPLPSVPSRKLHKYFALFLPKRRKTPVCGKSVERDDEAMHSPYIGDKVEVLNKPLRTFGTVRYVGPVQFTEGLCIGVELESRLGKSDGSIDGFRYFRTDPQRALFVQLEDLKILHHRK
ncbi:hypothetical protein BY458DRAFT_530760 [Sporodiniella umbellata]|nr:hypothetical protein BY458DRAFT_530760 [Sporodiniella umbellata]